MTIYPLIYGLLSASHFWLKLKRMICIIKNGKGGRRGRGEGSPKPFPSTTPHSLSFCLSHIPDHFISIWEFLGGHGEWPQANQGSSILFEVTRGHLDGRPDRHVSLWIDIEQLLAFSCLGNKDQHEGTISWTKVRASFSMASPTDNGPYCAQRRSKSNVVEI